MIWQPDLVSNNIFPRFNPELQIGENQQGARFSRAALDRLALRDLARLVLQDEISQGEMTTPNLAGRVGHLQPRSSFPKRFVGVQKVGCLPQRPWVG